LQPNRLFWGFLPLQTLDIGILPDLTGKPDIQIDILYDRFLIATLVNINSYGISERAVFPDIIL
jgi:hypothetical protein